MAKNNDRLLNEINVRKEVVSFGEQETKVEQANAASVENLGAVSKDDDVRVGTSVDREVVIQRPPKMETSFDSLSPLVQSTWGFLDKYVGTMVKNSHLPREEMITYQRKLVIALENIASSPNDREFMIMMTRLMDLINLHRNNAFDSSVIFRLWNSIPLQDNRLTRAANFVTMMRNFADPKARGTLVHNYPIETHSEIAGKYKERLINYLVRISGR